MVIPRIVSMVLDGEENRFTLSQPMRPVLKSGEGCDVLGDHCFDIGYPSWPRRAIFLLYQFIKSEITRLIDKYAAMVIVIISTACPD